MSKQDEAVQQIIADREGVRDAAADSQPGSDKRGEGEGILGADDFYMEGPYMVFTAAYHRRRGYCCNSECRHCPYR